MPPGHRYGSRRMSGRRNFLAGAAGLAVGTGGGLVSAASRPDAELIGLCAAFDAHEMAVQVIYDGPARTIPDDEAAALAFPHHERMGELMDQMEPLHATTPTGIAARARTLSLHAGHGHYSFDYNDGTAGRLLQFLLRDAAALGEAD